MPDISCNDVEFGDFAFNYSYCDSCSRSGSAMILNGGLHRICSLCLGDGLQLLMTLLKSDKKLV